MLSERLALYTTVYPGVEKYLSAWYDSVKAQTDRDFDVWIGVDELDVNTVIAAIGANPSAQWVMPEKGDSPAQIRQRAIEQIVQQYPTIVFSDSDDVLDPTRIEAARAALQESDVSGCAMRIIDEDGRDLRLTFNAPRGAKLKRILLRGNIFGLGNSAYRCEILSRCLPIPAACILIDWFLATYAWVLDARLHFDPACRISYCQHSNNMARILPPFTPQLIVSAADRVLSHYTCILTSIPKIQVRHKVKLEAARSYVAAFYDSISKSTDTLNKYVNALNRLPPNHIWWDIVAHPELEEIWRN